MKKKTPNPFNAYVVVSKQSEAIVQDTSSPASGVQYAPMDFSVLAELNSYNAWHSRCIELKSQIVAGIGFECDKKAMAFFDAHSAHARQTISETLVNIHKDYEIFGNAFIEIVRNKAGDVAELYHLPARYCYVVIDPETQEQYVAQIVGAARKDFTPFSAKKKRGKTEYIHIKSYNPASVFYGVPEWVGAIGAIVLDRNGVEFNAKRFQNNAIPDFIVTVSGGELGAEQLTAIKDFWQTNFKGSSNAGKTLILSSSDMNSKIDVKELGTQIKDASYTQLRLNARDEIIAAHGVPPRIAGISEAGKLGGISESAEQMRMFKELVIGPRQKRLEFIFNDILFPAMGIPNAGMKFNSIDLTDNANDADVLSKLLPLGVYTVDEARGMLGLGEGESQKVDTAGADVVKSLVNLRKQLEAIQ